MRQLRDDRQTRSDARAGPRAASLNLLWGLLLVGGGALVLLQSLGVLVEAGVVWAGAFTVVGVVLLGLYLVRADAWWAAIPAGALLGLAAAAGVGELLPTQADWGGAAFLGLAGLGFWGVYLRSHELWWAIIPGGVGVTLGLLAALSAAGVDNALQGGAFFLGLGATFLLVGALPTGKNPQRWAFIPGGILGAMGLLAALGAGGALERVWDVAWPAALIVVGLYLIWRTTGWHRPPMR